MYLSGYKYQLVTWSNSMKPLATIRTKMVLKVHMNLAYVLVEVSARNKSFRAKITLIRLLIIMASYMTMQRWKMPEAFWTKLTEITIFFAVQYFLGVIYLFIHLQSNSSILSQAKQHQYSITSKTTVVFYHQQSNSSILSPCNKATIVFYHQQSNSSTCTLLTNEIYVPLSR